MAVLQSETKNQILLPRLSVAKTFVSRGLGLLLHKSLSSEEGLLIYDCPIIHTCFMSFPIDCVFVDKKMVVQAVAENVKPWRMSKYYWKASAVIEMAAGSVQRLGIEVGEKLRVGN